MAQPPPQGKEENQNQHGSDIILYVYLQLPRAVAKNH